MSDRMSEYIYIYTLMPDILPDNMSKTIQNTVSFWAPMKQPRLEQHHHGSWAWEPAGTGLGLGDSKSMGFLGADQPRSCVSTVDLREH